LVRGDGEQPRAEAPLRIELIGRLMNLKERFLKDVFRRRAIAEEAHQEMKELALISFDQCREAGPLAVPVCRQQFLVGLVRQAIAVTIDGAMVIWSWHNLCGPCVRTLRVALPICVGK